MEVEDGAPLSARFERSPIGQVLISALIIVLIATEIGSNLPASSVERSVGATSGQIVRVLAMEQAWGVFAPDPRPTSIGLEARVTFADGSHATWRMPHGDPVISNLRYYRWRKWLERVRADDYKDIWDPTARWIASLYDDRPSPVTQVQLIRRWHDNTLSDPQPPWQSYVYDTVTIPQKGSGS